ncbi:MAG TPA: hypothetical protein ENH94_02710 [Phycisphaerales bacterium]|nr:hypothetical protein [Phycisphaerales bacterium]
MLQVTTDLCRKAAELNYSAKNRKGNILCFSDGARLIVTGDLHGHQRNFEKIADYADLKNNPDTHVVFQEILHGGPEDLAGGCTSFKVFFEVLRYKLDYPDQVHLIMGNHDTAIITDHSVLKNGKEMNQALKNGMRQYFGGESEAINEAVRGYLISQPIAIRCANRIWMSHSLPADRFVADFDVSIFDKKLEPDDMLRPKSLYTLTWGRRQSKKALAELAKLFDVDYFILGHQPQPSGWARFGDNLIILASDHTRGCLISFDPTKSYTLNELTECIVLLASLAGPSAVIPG